MASGDEVLIVDSSRTDREGMRKLFEGDGYVCTAVGEAAEATDLVDKKFFPAAFVDLDVGAPSGGVALAKVIRERSPQTTVVILAGRRSFEGSVEAFRAGVKDVVFKHPDQIEHLRELVDVACNAYRTAGQDTSLLADVRGVLDESFKVMLGMSRRIHGDASVGSNAARKARILVVDPDQKFLQELAQKIGDRNWEVSVEMTGGAALDKTSSHKFEIVVARNDLSDMPGAMIVKSIQANRPETIGAVYGSGAKNQIDRYERGQLIDSDKPFKGAAHLLEKIALLAKQQGEIERERRHLQAFRAEHAEFLKRYADLKIRVDALVKKDED